MFFVRFEDGTTATELDFGDWDHVPKDRRIKSVGLLLPLPEPANIVTWEPLPEGCEKYFCGRLGAAPLGGVDTWLGYLLIGVMNGNYVRVQATHKGLGPLKMGSIEELNIREEAWRYGVTPPDSKKVTSRVSGSSLASPQKAHRDHTARKVSLINTGGERGD